MDLICPHCNKLNEVEGEDLPQNACDDTSYECLHCEREMMIGWYAEVEVRETFEEKTT